MKRIIIIALTTAFISINLISCSTKENNKEVVEYITIDNHKAVNETIKVKDTAYRVPVGEENFKKLVTYIEKHGFVAPEKGVACDHQYTFFDKNGNRHAMIAIKRDKDGNPSLDGTVDQISVLGYYKGIKDQDHFFGYDITKERAFPFITEDAYVEKHIATVKEGYTDFLTLVNKD